MNLSCVGYTLNGDEVALGVPLSIRFESSIDQAQSRLTVTLSIKPTSSICRMALFQDTDCLFQGFIDWMEHTISEYGVCYRLSISSDSSRMMQNQVGPRHLINYSSEMLFAEYAKPYGAKGNHLAPATIAQMEVTVGMTAWQVVDLFCRQTYQIVPLMAREGVLTTSIGDQTWIIGGEDHPYTSLTQHEDRQDMISVVHYPLNDEDLYFTKTMTNTTATKLDISRERYWKTPACWKSMRQQGAAEVIRNSNHQLHSYEIVVPELMSVWPGDTVVLKGPIEDGSYYIQSFTLLYDEDGARTKMTLWDLVQR